MQRPTSPHVVFDFDGTLVETWQDIATGLNQALQENHLPTVEPSHVRVLVGHGARELIRKALPESARQDATITHVLGRFRDYYADCCLQQSRLYPGITACLAALRDATLGVVSNKPERFVRQMVQGLGLAEQLVLVMGGDTLPVSKPDPAVLTHAARSMGVVPEALWMVGDSDTDILAAKAVGARSIGVSWGYRDAAVLRKAGADHLVDHPAAIAPIVLGQAARGC